MITKAELEIKKSQLEIDLCDLGNEFDDMVNIDTGLVLKYCPRSTIINCKKLMDVAADCPYLCNTLPRVELSGCSKEVKDTYSKIKQLRTQYKKIEKALSILKPKQPAKVINKPRGTVVEKQETKLRNTTNGHFKFWNIKQLDSLVITEWGAIGTAGESLVKKFDTVNEATIYFQKKEQEKFKKGYVRV